MGPFWLIVVVVLLALSAVVAGRVRAAALARQTGERLHSRPAYYGSYLAVWTALPAIVLLIVLAILRPMIVDTAVRQQLPEAALENVQQLTLTMGVIEEVARGLKLLSPDELNNLKLGLVAAKPLFASKGIALAGDVQPYIVAAAQTRNSVDGTLRTILEAAVIAAAAFGFVIAYTRIKPRLRARGAVETVVLGLLIGAASIAILTTVGIVASMLFEALNFFSQVSPANFFFGTVWDPRFADAGAGDQQGQFGLLPLAFGTLYISLIAMLVAVPIGLFAAIYMAEYATPTVRGIAKPLLEILAGIPTIVYGFFALVTVGPLLRDFIAQPLGLGTSGNNVLTAGLVMGIMIIPYVSSLSDDIITAVPRAMREGSLGLGATTSETIKRVVLPAALPGIVGAILLAASRAIGETMIVVLAAGVAARISMNPFDEMTTITVKIVNQLTGDLEFTSPQTLVAFALGITLFTVTLGLNIIALHIVRKYREQYE